MTRLLLSVRTPDEAALAVSAGVDLVDVKEPWAGSLGCPSLVVARAVVERVAHRRPLSIATGELRDRYGSRRVPATCHAARILEVGVGTRSPTPAANSATPGASDVSPDGPVDLGQLARGYRFAKCGLAGCGDEPQWPEWLARWRSELPREVSPVVALYADRAAAGVPEFEAVLQTAAQLGLAGLLVDTYDKRRGSLLAHWSLDRVARVVSEARRLGLLIVLAGSLDAAAIERLLPLRPDYVGVRGAACRGDRRGTLDFASTQRLVQLVSGRVPA